MLLAGLWLNIPDYDAPTQMVKPKERNERYVDAVLTIPKVRPPASAYTHCPFQAANALMSAARSDILNSSLMQASVAFAGITVPHVRHEPGLQPGAHWACHVLRTHG